MYLKTFRKRQKYYR